MSAEHDLAKAIADAVDAKVASMRPESTTMPATYQGTDSEGKAWVLLPGATEPTPVSRMAVEAAQGDTVSVTVANGKATIGSNVSNPSAGLAGVKVVEKTANVAKDTAVQAIDYASAAQSAASAAQSSADAAYKHADEAAQEAVNAQASAATANAAATAATEDAAVAHAMAESASADAAQASASATVAKESADKATFALSDVENVVGTLNWIAEHGEYVLTEDTAIVEGKAYYTRSGTDPDYVYTVVASPDASELSTYYELQLDESVQNYLASHLWLDDYGLNLSVDSANGYRIHQGTVDGTKTAGTYIIDSQGAIVASFGMSGFQVGLDDESHLIGDYHSLQLLDKEGDTYFHVSDLRDENGLYELTETFTGNGTNTDFGLMFYADEGLAITIDGDEVAESAYSRYVSYFRTFIKFNSAPSNGAIIRATYSTRSSLTKAFTMGTRSADGEVKPYSYALGYDVEASGHYSFASGNQTEATAPGAHAEGSSTKASGGSSHAEGTFSRALGANSHAEGNSTASGACSHSEGSSSTASADNAHAEGLHTTASGYSSHAEGFYTVAGGYYSHAGGSYTKASSNSQTALGKYNVEDANGTYAVIIGNGTADNARSNALTADWDGIVGAQNVGMYGTCDTAAATADKVATLDDYGVTFKLVKGAVVRIYMANSNTVADPTLNVNGTGAKAIKRYGNTAPGTASGSSWIGGTVMTFLYAGTYWRLCDYRNNDNTVPSAYCSTAAATAAKVASCSGYALLSKSFLHVILTASNTAASALTLNVNSKGAKPIYINGTASSSSNYTLPAGSYLVYYNGTNYYFRTDGLLTASVTGNAGTATKLATARSLYASLGTVYDSASPVTFDGSANKALPITGTLGIAHGGTGSTAVASVTTVSSIATAGTNISITSGTYKSWGKMAMFEVVIKPSAAISSGATVFTMVSGKRPALYAIGNDSSSTSPISINTSGAVVCRRALTSGTSYTFRATYLLA